MCDWNRFVRMRHPFIKCTVFIVVVLLFGGSGNSVSAASSEQHLMVMLRMVGHRVLQYAGDSSSRVLPIEKKGERYKVQFDTEFAFVPDSLIAIVNQAALSTQTTSGYLIEVVGCDTNEVVYSYEIGNLNGRNVIPCRGRDQPKGCYELWFTPMGTVAGKEMPVVTENPDESKRTHYALLALPVVLIGGLVVMIRKKKSVPEQNPNLIAIGQYQFDKLNSDLILDGERAELTSKEADLLLLLFEQANHTVERGTLLNKVWGDEGDYIGRTLDVFISKLRKKLEADPNVKIVNVRGVGYKLVVVG